MCYPILPSLPKATSLQQILQKIAINMIISLLQIQFTQHSRFPSSNQTIKTLTSYHEESRICLPLINAFCELEILFPNTNFNLFVRTLEMILYTPPTNLIGRKSLMSTAPAFLGIRDTKVALKLFSNFLML